MIPPTTDLPARALHGRWGASQSDLVSTRAGETNGRYRRKCKEHRAFYSQVYAELRESGSAPIKYALHFIDRAFSKAEETKKEENSNSAGN